MLSDVSERVIGSGKTSNLWSLRAFSNRAWFRFCPGRLHCTLLCLTVLCNAQMQTACKQNCTESSDCLPFANNCRLPALSYFDAHCDIVTKIVTLWHTLKLHCDIVTNIVTLWQRLWHCDTHCNYIVTTLWLCDSWLGVRKGRMQASQQLLLENNQTYGWTYGCIIQEAECYIPTISSA